MTAYYLEGSLPRIRRRAYPTLPGLPGSGVPDLCTEYWSHAIVRVTAFHFCGSLPRIARRGSAAKKGGRIAITGKLVQGVRNTTPLKE